MQPDNQILVVAYNTVDFNSTVFRFDANGVLDPSFGNSGYADLDFGAANIRLLDNGQFIVAGEYFDSTRLNDDGSVDATYGDGGYSQPDVVGDTYSHALEILPSGQLQFVGRNYDGQFDDMTVARVNADGSLDTTYGTNGFYTIDTGANETAFGLVIDADGSSFVLGEWNDYSGQFVGGETVQDFAVAKLTPAGILDTSFGGDGFVTTGVVGSYAVGDSAFGVVEQADGKIIVGGSLNFQNQGDVALVRYLADGSVDTTYGDRGVAIIDIGNEIGYEFDVTMQADGKVIVAGPTTIDFDNSFAVARVNTDGTLDNTFGTNGTAVVSANGNIYATAVVVQNDGKIVIGGYGYTNEGRYILTRLNPDGSMDDDFGMQFYSGFSGTIEDLAMQGTKIIVTGGNNGDAAATLRINEDGTRDFTFGNNGVAFTNLSFQYESGTEVVVQPDNKIVIASSDRVGNTSDWAVERYNANGTLDTSFGNNGLFTLDVTGGFDGDALNTLALQADGKILIGGHSDNQFKVGRLNSNGTLDTSFGDSGITTASFGSQRANERVNDVTVLSNGDTIAVGQIDPGWAIARILGNETVVDPVAVNDAFSTLETDVVVGNLFADNGFGADFDYLGQAFTVTQVNGLPANVGSQIQLPSGALLTVMADGNFAYDPNGQFDYLDDGEFDSDVFSYEISTDAASHDTAIVTVTIEGVTNFSVVADVLASEMNTRLNYDSSVNDTVSESAIYTIFEAPQHGAISMQADGRFSYRPIDGYVGLDHFVYQVLDGADMAFADVDITVGDQALIDDLVAYWSFDQESGNVIDLAPNDAISDDGILFANPEFSLHGFLNKGIVLDGSGDAVHIPTSSEINDLQLTQRTISLWFRANDLPVNGSKQVLYEEGAQTGFNIYIQDGILYLGVWRNFERGFNTFINTATGAIEANQWHQVSLVLDVPKSGLGTITGYLDGQQFAQGEAEYVAAHPAGIGIGAINAGSAFHDTGRFNRNPSNFTGTIDEVRIYNRALDAAEIQALTPANLQDDLTVHWAADDGAGTILSDTSPEGQDNSAQLVGVQYVQGQNGGGLLFDGTGYIDVNNSPDINLAEVQQRTISLNFKADALDGGRQVLYKQGFQSGFNIYLENGELVVGGYRNAGRGWQKFFRTSNIQADQWHQVTLVLQSTGAQRGSFTVYLDGQLIGSSLAGSINATSNSIGLGRLRDGAVFQNSGSVTNEDYLYSGLMDDIRMYNRALTSDEVLALYRRR